jgi:hypothetical protein
VTTHPQVQVRELAACGLDDNHYRPQLDQLTAKVTRARAALADREPHTPTDPTCPNLPESLAALLSEQANRTDLHAEMQGLDWTTGVVDLRRLLAFQRRLIFDEQLAHPDVPVADDWPALVARAFGPAARAVYSTTSVNSWKFIMQSENPNLQIRFSPTQNASPFEIHAGSPFFEVAEYRGRWFLRDGYHRAYRLLRANVTYFPAVIIKAATLAELGPVQPWFFAEEVLFSSRPPRLIDFLDDALIIEYQRPRLLKTLRVTIEESVEPA